jgi:hypothetical protein
VERTAFKEATEKYSGQVKLGPDGLGLQNYVAGRPFPTIDTNDKLAPVKIMQNFNMQVTIDDLDLRNFGLEDVTRLLMQKLGPPREAGAVDPGEVTGVVEVLSHLYRRSIFTRFHAQLNAKAMFTSMSDCRVALQKQIVFVRPREAQQLVAGIIAELDLVERVIQQGFTWEGLGTMGTVDGAKLRIIAAMRTLADMSGTPLEFPTSVTEELFWTPEDADAAPSGPETWAGWIYGGGGHKG